MLYISDYTCALMKDILVQGKLYASQNFVCFHSNILKWQTAVCYTSLYRIVRTNLNQSWSRINES